MNKVKVAVNEKRAIANEFVFDLEGNITEQIIKDSKSANYSICIYTCSETGSRTKCITIPESNVRIFINWLEGLYNYGYGFSCEDSWSNLMQAVEFKTCEPDRYVMDVINIDRSSTDQLYKNRIAFTKTEFEDFIRSIIVCYDAIRGLNKKLPDGYLY